MAVEYGVGAAHALWNTLCNGASNGLLCSHLQVAGLAIVFVQFP